MRISSFWLPAAVLLILQPLFLAAQSTQPTNGVVDDRSGLHAFTNATVTISPGVVVEGGTLLIRNGKVEAAGKNVNIPAGTVVHDASGEYIYAAFVDPFTSYGIPKRTMRERESDYEQLDSELKGPWGWNEALVPEFDAATHYVADDSKASSMRKAGFGAVMTHRRDGIARGTGAVVLLHDAGMENSSVVMDRAASVFSFRKGNSPQPYPSSLMGAIALLRQSEYDARWYETQDREYNITLEAWNRNGQLQRFFEVDDVLDLIRAQKIANEFGLKYTYVTAGDDYQRLDAVKATGSSLIIPLNYPKAYEVMDPLNAELVSVTDMKHWEMAPANATMLEDAGIDFAWTTLGLESPSSYLDAIRRAIEYGLSEEHALAAMTTRPARIAGAEAHLGSLEVGKYANFIRCSGPLFEEGSKIYQTWIAGEAYTHSNPDAADMSGKYRLKVLGLHWDLIVEGSPDKPSAKIMRDTVKIDATIEFDDRRVTMRFIDTDGDGEERRFSGWYLDGRFSGRYQDRNGDWGSWEATRRGVADSEDKESNEVEKESPEIGDIWFPFQAYGMPAIPDQDRVIFRNATVWTNTEQGIVENTDVLIADGKIVAVGTELKDRGALEVDATGMHLTNGIIDEHSHIAISRGVNEGTQTSSAEVRIGDVVNSEDVNIYRQLAGGVTTAQLLHGSANPIGGQSALIKMRWGSLPEDMKVENADGFIKFALGENVKQSNWGDNNRVRFPQTRMGVEQVYVDFFTKAVEYGERKAAGDPTLRTDLELEALLEIVNSERFITCHSYVQSEINMLMKVAESFGFRMNTFTHILEGYKVADKMAAHGVGGSTFADWWAYKYEVIDAIPYNAALMHEQGVVVAINSDDAEMARRLNQEAAKVVKYGGVSQEEAWKMVTLNPAKLLHLDNRLGTVEQGKDADLVLWSGNPLSVQSVVQQTWIDGRMYFSIEADKFRRAVLQQERIRLINKMIDAKHGGAPTQPVKGKEDKLWHCDDLEDMCSGH